MTQTNPWAANETKPTEATDNPWGTSSSSSETVNETAEASNSWLTAVETPEPSFSLLDPFASYTLPLDSWVNSGLTSLVTNFRGVFQAIRAPIDSVLTGVEAGFTSLPALVVIAFLALLAWQLVSKRLAIASVFSLLLIGFIGAWSEAMVTLALVITSLFFCLLIGLPLGIWLANNDRAAGIARPLLDAMQTTPPFVYLVPIVMLFGIGNVPGVVVTIVFALPPLIRLTNLGIRQVPEDLIEAATSFGASPRQLLFKVQLPLAMPTIMAGINQTLMLALSMVVIASMIAVGGLGQMVLRGIGRLDMGLATVGGLGIVILAILLDRMTQAFNTNNQEGLAEQTAPLPWFKRGPIGLVLALTHKLKTK